LENERKLKELSKKRKEELRDKSLIVTEASKTIKHKDEHQLELDRLYFETQQFGLCCIYL